MKTPMTFFRFVPSLLILSSVLWAGGVEGRVSAKISKYEKDVVVYIDRIEGETFDPPAEPVVMDQKELVFLPRVLPVVVGTQVDFLNSDDVLHNVFTPDKVADRFNLGTYPQGMVRSKVFHKPGSAVILCNVHPEMEAYVVAVETPYFAVTDKEGRFTIKDVPPGNHTLKLWSERYEAQPQEIEVPATGSTTATFVLEK